MKNKESEAGKKLESIKDIAKKLYELVQHEDYRNGITAYGVDEGEVQLSMFLEDISRRYYDITGNNIERNCVTDHASKADEPDELESTKNRICIICPHCDELYTPYREEEIEDQGTLHCRKCLRSFYYEKYVRVTYSTWDED